MSAAMPVSLSQHVGRLRRRGDPEHRPALAGRGRRRRRRASSSCRRRPGRRRRPADRAGDRRGGVGLQDVEPVAVDGGRRVRVVGLGVERPGEDAFFLGQDRVAVKWAAVGSSHTDRPSEPRGGGPSSAGSRSTQRRSPGRRPVRARPPTACPGIDGHAGAGGRRSPAARRPGSRSTRRRQAVDDLGHRHRRTGSASVRRSAASTGRRRPVAVQPSRRGFARPPCPQTGDAGAGLVARVSAAASRVIAARSHAGRVPTLPGPELGDLRGERRVDLLGPLREHLQQLGRDRRRSRPGR